MAIEQGILSTPSNNGSSIQVSNEFKDNSTIYPIYANGMIILDNNSSIFYNNESKELALVSGSKGWKDGAGLVLRDGNASSSGSFWLKAHDVENDIENGLFGKANKSLSWCGYSISQLSMPSNKYINLEIGSSGTWYNAPANGWFFIEAQATAVSSWISAYSSNSQIAKIGTNSKAVSATDGLNFFLPVQKNDSIVVSYSTTTNVESVKFYYSVLDSIITE